MNYEKSNTIVVENVGNNTQSKTIHNEENADVDKTGCIPVLENLDGGLYVNESNVHEEQQVTLFYNSFYTTCIV